jgi:hypothetical protein
MALRTPFRVGVLAAFVSSLAFALLVVLLAPPLRGLLDDRSAPTSSATVARDYASLPQRFEPNRGQSDPRVDFLSHGRGYSLFLAGGDATLVLGREGHHGKATALRMALAGASPGAVASGAGRLPGGVNYLRGHHPSARQTAIPTYRGVSYHGVYPGVDLRYYGSQRKLEYDFSLAPHADPSRIALDFSGTRAVDLAPNGDLLLRLSGGTLRERAPVAFQRIGGERRVVDARYVVHGSRVSFALGAYDRSRPLTIDPVVLTYSTYLGGGTDEQGYGIAVDSAGSAYVGGWTSSTNFPATAGAWNTSKNGLEDAFVAKLAPDGRSLVYATYIGGTDQDLATGLAVDSTGSAYLTGRTLGSDFPVTTGAAQDTAPGGPADAFVTKLTPSGAGLAYSTYLGGADQDNGEAIAVDSAGAAYVTGFADSSDFPTKPTVGAYDTTLGGTRDDFVTKVAPDGKSFPYSTYLGGSGDEGSCTCGIAVDSAGSAYVTGTTKSTNFPTTVSAFDTTLGGTSDFYVTKLAPDGKSLAYSTYLGGTGTETGVFGDIAIDSVGSAYVTGDTSSTDFPTKPTVGAYDTTLGGTSDAFVTKLAPNGQSLPYSTYLGGGSDEFGSGIAVDSAGAAYLTGSTFSTNFPTTTGARDTTLGGSSDAFYAKLASNGQSLADSTYLGGGATEFARRIAIDSAGSAYLTGLTQSGDFPTTPSPLDGTLGGSNDAYISKLGASGPPPLPQCSDGVDNDGDGKTDYPADPGCTSAADDSESPNPSSPTAPGIAAVPAQCADGRDNDSDGAIDKQDPGCSSATDNNEADESLNDLVLCGRRQISLVRADVKGRKVALSGLVAQKLAGKPVQIFATYGGGKSRSGRFTRLASTKSDSSGRFAASVRRPPGRLFAKARYLAQVEGARSVALKLPQSLASSSVKQAGQQIEVKGKVKRPLLGSRNAVTIKRLVCGRYQTVGSAKPGKSGSYVVRFPAPTLGAAALYRAEAKVLARPGSKRYVKQFARAVGIQLTGQTG